MEKRSNQPKLTRFADQRSVSACDQSNKMIRRNPLERIRRRGTLLVWGRAPSPVQAGRSPAVARCHSKSGFPLAIERTARIAVSAAKAGALFCAVAVTLFARPATA